MKERIFKVFLVFMILFYLGCVAISFITKGAVEKYKAVKVVKIDGIPPRNKDYPLSQIFSFISKGKPVGPAEKFINFVSSNEGKEIIKRRGMIPIK